MSHDPVKQAWQASVEAGRAPPLNEVRAGADKFYRLVRRRNGIEYAACVLVVVGFAYNVFIMPHILQKAGSALVVVATFYVAWQLHRRASAEPPERAGAVPIYVFQRSQLARQRDALRGIFWWYILPFLPGIALVFAGNGLHPETEAAGPEHWVRWLVFAGMFLMAAGVWWINQLVARRLQRQIDDIDALMGREE